MLALALARPASVAARQVRRAQAALEASEAAAAASRQSLAESETELLALRPAHRVQSTGAGSSAPFHPLAHSHSKSKPHQCQRRPGAARPA